MMRNLFASNFRSHPTRGSVFILAALALYVPVACSSPDPVGGGTTDGQTSAGTTTESSSTTTDSSASTTTGSGSGGAGNNGYGYGYGTGEDTSTGGAVMVPSTVECSGALPVDDVSGAQHTITVNHAESWGKLPHFWNSQGTGHLGLYLRENDEFGNNGAVLKEHTLDGVANLDMRRIRSHGLFHDDIGIYGEDESGNPVLDFSKSDLIFDFLNDQGLIPIIELGPMPSALASDPSATVFDWGMGISPPKDYAKWETLVAGFAAHYLERYGMDTVSQWEWEVWNEPECCNGKFWTGGMAGYMELYDTSVAAVHSVMPNAPVGGPVTSQPKLLPEAGVQFLTHVKDTQQHLGFFAYHSWSFVGASVDGYFEALDLLDQFGFNNVRATVTEFGPTWEFGLYDEPADMDQGAAFAVQTYADISRRVAQEGRRWPISYSWWVLSDVFEEVMEDYRNDEPFIGCMGLISRQGIKKPAYNSYHFLSQMGGEQLSTDIAGSNVGGMAARDKAGGVQVLVYNGQNPGNGPDDDTYYSDTEAHSIAVSVQGLDPDVTYDVTAYRVDDTRGNAYAVWESKGRPKMDAMTDADWQELRDTMESPAEPVGQAICGSSYSQVFDLPSPGVLFLNFKPAVAQ